MDHAREQGIVNVPARVTDSTSRVPLTHPIRTFRRLAFLFSVRGGLDLWPAFSGALFIAREARTCGSSMAGR